MTKKEYLEIRKELIKYYETGEATSSLISLIEKYDTKYKLNS